MPNKNFNDQQKGAKQEIDPAEKKVKLDTSNEIIELLPTVNNKLVFDPNYPNVIKLTEEQTEKVEKMLREDLEQHKTDSAPMVTECAKYEMMYACEPDPKFDNDPYPGASNTRSPWASIAAKGKVVRWIQSIFGIEPYCMVEHEDPNVASSIENWFHFMLTRVMRFYREYRDVFFALAKLNTGIAMLSWERKYEKVYEDNVTYTDLNLFLQDFPSAKEAGIKEEEYQSLLTQLQTVGQIQLQKTAKFKKVYNAPKLENVNRDKFVIIPFSAKKLELARGHGYEFELNWNDLKMGEAENRYINIDRIKKTGGEDSDSEADKERDTQESKNVAQDIEPEKRIFKAYKLIYNYDIDDDGKAEKLIFTFLYNEKVLIRAELWDENLYFVPHYCETRPGRFDGIGVCKSVEPINDQGDTVWNLRNNAARMVCSPSFKAKKGSDFDPTEQEWYPGVVFWLESFDDFEQIVLMNNFPELYNEETLLDKYTQMKTGMTSGHGGREMSSDPNAPGNKTIALIQEGNILINDDISCLRDSVEMTFYYLVKMCAKYLDDDDKYLKRFNLTKQALNISLDQMQMRGISVSMNKEVRKMEEVQFYQTYRNDPLLQQDLEAVRLMLESSFKAWGKDKEKMVPSQERVQQMMMQAMQQIMAQQAAAKAQAVEKAVGDMPPPPPPPPPPGSSGMGQGGVNG